MAARCIVVTPDAVGNREYCSFGTNCVLVEWESVTSYTAALDRIASMPAAERSRIQVAGAAAAQARRLVEEQHAFARLLADLNGDD
jgi:hypothetical protein